MMEYILVALAGAMLGGAIVIFSKLQFSAGWSNKEFDGTMFIAVILIAFCGTMVGTYVKESFAKLETTKMALDIFENIFMIIVGYLFKKAVDAERNGGNRNGEQK